MDHRLSKALKSGLVSLLRRSRLASPLRERLGGAGVILVLHEIHDDLACELMTGCSPSLLTVVVNSLRRDGWDIVGLDEALRRIAPGGAFHGLCADRRGDARTLCMVAGAARLVPVARGGSDRLHGSSLRVLRVG